MPLHPDLERAPRRTPLRGSVTFKDGTYNALQKAMLTATEDHGVKFGTAMKVIGTIGADAFNALSKHEQEVALGLLPF